MGRPEVKTLFWLPHITPQASALKLGDDPANKKFIVDPRCPPAERSALLEMAHVMAAVNADDLDADALSKVCVFFFSVKIRTQIQSLHYLSALSSILSLFFPNLPLFITSAVFCRCSETRTMRVRTSL